MPLYSNAQELVIVDPASTMHEDFFHHDNEDAISIVPLEASSPLNDNGDRLEVTDAGDIEIIIADLPGAPAGSQDPKEEESLEVVDKDSESVDSDNNDAKKSKKNEKWDWESKGPQGFIVWIKERIDNVPTHSGQDSAGLERAISYMEKLDNEISRAMRLDLDGELDADKIEEVRAKIDDGLSRLYARLEKVRKVSKKRRKKSEYKSSELIKEGQKITGVQGVFVTVDLLTSRIARVCINGMISAGHDIEDIYNNQIKKYNLNNREQAQVMQLLADMGYPLRQDRGYLPDEDIDTSSSDNFDWSANYKG